MRRIRVSIGTKLIGLLTFLIVSSVFGVVWCSSQLYVAETTALIEQVNTSNASNLAQQFREVFEGISENIRLVGMRLAENSQNTAIPVPSELLAKEGTLLGVALYEFDDEGKPSQRSKIYGPEMEAMGDIDRENLLRDAQKDGSFSLEDLYRGEPQLSSVSLSDGSPLLLIGIPLIAKAGGGGYRQVAIGFGRYKRILKAFSQGDLATQFLVDRKGRVLAHPEMELVTERRNLANIEIVKQLLQGKANSGHARYLDSTSQEPNLGAFKAVGFAGMGVISTFPESKAMEAVKRAEYRGLLISVIGLGLSLLFGTMFARSLLSRIRLLINAAKRVGKGDFKLAMFPRTRDELADVCLAFNLMAESLDEHEKSKPASPFKNKEVQKNVAEARLSEAGDVRHCTILCTDLRGFTSLSDTLPANEVVDMLNEYIALMVAIIRTHGGTIDKLMGDAIIATWGVPAEGEDDTANALFACLEMRSQIAKLNAARVQRKEAPFKMGMGLNFGEVVVGMIGTTDRSEYTVIGSNVNISTRLESMTRQYGTDLLISQSVYERVRDSFLFERCGTVLLSGQEAGFSIFKLGGYIDERTGEKVQVKTAYSDYDPEETKSALINVA